MLVWSHFLSFSQVGTFDNTNHDRCSKSSVTVALYSHLYINEAPDKFDQCLLRFGIWLVLILDPALMSSATHFILTVFSYCSPKPIYQLKRKDMHKLCMRQTRLKGRSPLTAFETRAHSRHSCRGRISATWQYNRMLGYFP